MPSPVRTRFAPSPTGDLHLGSARTALFAWLFARHHGGHYLLRLEDTDVARSTSAHTQAVQEALAWLGLHADAPWVVQSQRLERHRQVVASLVEADHAYRCTCSKERLAALRDRQLAQQHKPRYDGHCRAQRHSAHEPHVVRLKIPQSGTTTVHDRIHGAVVFQHDELDDLIIQRQDGMPTYHLASVVDDWDMQITHVIRGDDHLNNTPRHVLLHHALGAPLPVYYHVPMIVGPEGQKLSKRDGAASVLAYRREGYLPQAVLNLLVRLGWSHGDQEIFSVDEMVQHFDGTHLSASPAALNHTKALWLNQQHMQRTPPEDMVPAVQAQFQDQAAVSPSEARCKAVIALQHKRCKTLKELVEKSLFLIDSHQPSDGLQAVQVQEQAVPKLQALLERLVVCEPWEADTLHACLRQTAEQLACKFGELAPLVRLALTGSTSSPPLGPVMALLGRDVTQQRLQLACDAWTPARGSGSLL